MIPNAYFILEEVPQTTSGKIDRGRIRQMASALPKSDLVHADRKHRRAPRTNKESRLHNVVAQVLSLDVGAFGMGDNFIQLGGDSISAMKLVARAHADGMIFTVADVLTKKHIGDLTSEDSDAKDELSPLPPSNKSNLGVLLGSEALLEVQPGHGNLIDILPTTHMLILKTNIVLFRVYKDCMRSATSTERQFSSPTVVSIKPSLIVGISMWRLYTTRKVPTWVLRRSLLLKQRFHLFWERLWPALFLCESLVISPDWFSACPTRYTMPSVSMRLSRRWQTTITAAYNHAKIGDCIWDTSNLAKKTAMHIGVGFFNVPRLPECQY
jgi:aryl carrier-like protein